MTLPLHAFQGPTSLDSFSNHHHYTLTSPPPLPPIIATSPQHHHHYYNKSSPPQSWPLSSPDVHLPHRHAVTPAADSAPSVATDNSLISQRLAPLPKLPSTIIWPLGEAPRLDEPIMKWLKGRKAKGSGKGARGRRRERREGLRENRSEGLIF